jgi:UDP-N-acetyl-D-glucosamine dehydrogenase
MHQAQIAVQPPPLGDPAAGQVAVVGLGYVGLPTSLALARAGFPVVGVDVSERRLRDIRAGNVDVIPEDRRRLADALDNPEVMLTSDTRALRAADAVLICVPTPVDADHRPDLGPLRAACASVVAHARAGQVLVLTSTSHVGATRELLANPLAQRGLVAGNNVHIAFSPERIDPGNVRNPQHTVPRVIGGVTPACAEAAVRFLSEIAASLVVVSSAEVAELAKLYENTFRAVNIALANELADVARAHHLDAFEVVEAAGTKPYGFMPFYPGPGVGGHCIPCDPHYLLTPLDRLGARAPLVSQAMQALHARPRRIVRRAIEILASDAICIRDARVLVVGIAYKPGIADLRESPGCEILHGLRALGANVEYYDPRVASLQTEDGVALLSVRRPDPSAYDLALVTLVHPDDDLSWIDACDRVLDCTYRLSRRRRCELV